MKKIHFVIVLSLLLSACTKSPKIGADYLGGGTIFDPSTYNPQLYLLSAAHPNPTPQEALKPVIITCHGYSASTFEWDELKTWSAGRTDYYISQVLLAGHGTTYDEFKKSTWHNWQASIMEEYAKLVNAGYKNINFAALD